MTILFVSFRNSATVGRLEQVQLCNRQVDQSADNITGLKCANECLILTYKYIQNPWGGYRPFGNFSLSPQNQKESHLSHLVNLRYILCGHFDKTKIRGTPWGKVSKLKGKKNLKSPFWKKTVYCMVLKLTSCKRKVISFSYKPKLGEISIFKTFLAKFSILAYISFKIGYFEFGHDYDVTYFGMHGKRRHLAIILWYQVHFCGVSILKFTGRLATSSTPWEDVLQRRLGLLIESIKH